MLGAAGGTTEEDPGYSIRRMIGAFYARTDQAGNRGNVASGITVVSDDAHNGGAVPDPATDFVPWYWLAHVVVGGSVDDWTRVEFDIRTGRVLRGPGQVLEWITDNPAALNVEIFGWWRLLVSKL